MERAEKVKEIKEIFESIYVFTSLYNSTDPDWSRAADKFIAWNIHKDFKTKSFESFVDWIDDENINNAWYFFYGYGGNFKKFAEDWVEETEQEDYLEYCESNY